MTNKLWEKRNCTAAATISNFSTGGMKCELREEFKNFSNNIEYTRLRNSLFIYILDFALLALKTDVYDTLRR